MSSTPTIPKPETDRLFFGATHSIAGIEVAGLDVIYTSDQVKVTFLVRPRASLCSTGLSRALANHETLGKVVVQATAECGGTIDDVFGFTVTGSPDEIAAVRTAISHFYADERDPEARKVFRGIYRRLEKHTSSREQ